MSMSTIGVVIVALISLFIFRSIGADSVMVGRCCFARDIERVIRGWIGDDGNVILGDLSLLQRFVAVSFIRCFLLAESLCLSDILRANASRAFFVCVAAIVCVVSGVTTFRIWSCNGFYARYRWLDFRYSINILSLHCWQRWITNSINSEGGHCWGMNSVICRTWVSKPQDF